MDSLREEIDAACLADPCSPRIIDTLESYLSELVKAKAYDFERLKLLAKLYAFFPELSNTKYVGLIMVKALMHEPEMDFTVVSHVVPEKVQNEESILMVAEAAQRIENGEFNLFWAEHAPKVLKEFKVPGFEDAIRRHIISVLSRTFQDAPAALCASMLGFEVKDLAAFATEEVAKGVGMKISGDTVTFAKTEENQPRPQTLEGGINLQGMMPTIQQLVV